MSSSSYVIFGAIPAKILVVNRVTAIVFLGLSSLLLRVARTAWSKRKLFGGIRVQSIDFLGQSFGWIR